MKIIIHLPVWGIQPADAQDTGALFLNSEGRILRAFSEEEAYAFIAAHNSGGYMLGATPKNLGTAEIEAEVDIPPAELCAECSHCFVENQKTVRGFLEAIIAMELKARSNARDFNPEGVINAPSPAAVADA